MQEKRWDNLIDPKISTRHVVENPAYAYRLPAN